MGAIGNFRRHLVDVKEHRVAERSVVFREYKRNPSRVSAMPLWFLQQLNRLQELATRNIMRRNWRR